MSGPLRDTGEWIAVMRPLRESRGAVTSDRGRRVLLVGNGPAPTDPKGQSRIKAAFSEDALCEPLLAAFGL